MRKQRPLWIGGFTMGESWELQDLPHIYAYPVGHCRLGLAAQGVPRPSHAGHPGAGDSGRSLPCLSASAVPLAAGSGPPSVPPAVPEGKKQGLGLNFLAWGQRRDIPSPLSSYTHISGGHLSILCYGLSCVLQNVICGTQTPIIFECDNI